jgi:hypothetical protein
LIGGQADAWLFLGGTALGLGKKYKLNQ